MNALFLITPARLIALSAISLTIAVTAEAAPTMLRPGDKIQAGAVSLDPGSQAIPCSADWNGDGLADLIVGYQTAGKLALYLNDGTATEPAFTAWSNLRANGVEIQHTSGGCGAPGPWVCDYNGDGQRDLLVGRGADGQVHFYPNTNTDADPILGAGNRLVASGATLNVGSRATPYVHDWDEDGLPDLLCGAGDGRVYWFRNTGTRQAPVYGASVPIQAGGSIVSFGIRSAVRVCDWDGDGLKDLVGSASSNVSWCRNVGSNASPQLQAPVSVEAPASGVGLSSIQTWSSRNRLELADWNKDGIIDLLVGDYTGTITCYLGYAFCFTAIAPSLDNQFRIEWNSADYLKYDLWAGSSLDCLCDKLAENLPSEGNITSWTNSLITGQQFFKVELAP